MTMDSPYANQGLKTAPSESETIKTNPTMTYKTGEDSQTIDGILLSRPLAKNILDRIVKCSTHSFLDGFALGFVCGVGMMCLLRSSHRCVTRV